jgi:deoxyribonuclease-4
MAKEALSIGGNTFQYFTRNPRGGAVKALDLDDIKAYLEFAKTHGIGQIIAHAPYTLNPASDTEKTREFAHIVMTDDIRRLEYIPGSLYNFHPGSHVGQGAEKGIQLIVKLLNEILSPNQKTIVLLETMSGKGSEIGKTFEELAEIIKGCHSPKNLGVCLDTCHVYSAGYDIVGDLDGVLDHFDRALGLERLHAIHLNDSMMPFDSRKDRHEKIGKGTIGLDAILRIINHPKLRHLPFFLETPNELPGYASEIELLKANYSTK